MRSIQSLSLVEEGASIGCGIALGSDEALVVSLVFVAPWYLVLVGGWWFRRSGGHSTLCHASILTVRLLYVPVPLAEWVGGH